MYISIYISTYHQVYRLSRRFALVDEANCSLLRYALSYVQSGLVLRRPLLANENAKDLDTFQLVDSAAQSMENGDLVQVIVLLVKYVFYLVIIFILYRIQLLILYMI